MQTVTVRGVWLPGHMAQVAVWERDPRHPAGELYLTSGQVDTVCLTPGINAALVRGSLELVGSTGSPTGSTGSPTGSTGSPTGSTGSPTGSAGSPTREPPAAELVEAELAQAEPSAGPTAKAADTKVMKHK